MLEPRVFLQATCSDFVATFGASEGTLHPLFPTCQVRVVRFYVSCLLLSSSPLLLLLNRDPRRTVFSVGPQPRPSTPSVPCRTSTTTIPAQCSLPDLNHDHPRPVFPAGPQPQVSTPSVPCRTSTATSRSQWALPDLNRELQIPVGTAGPQPRAPDPSGHCRTSTATSRSQWALPDLNGKNVRKDVR